MISPDQASILYAIAAQDDIDLDDEIALIQHVAQQVIEACQTAHIEGGQAGCAGWR